MSNKKMLLASAILICSMSNLALADDSMEIHGYAKTGMVLNDNMSSGGVDFGKGDFFLGTDGTSPANQFELVGSKKFTSDNGAQGKLEFRLEYGNGTPGKDYFYSSSGGEAGDRNYFELKEAFVELEKLDVLPKDSKIWAGRKFYGRDSTACSGEFWKQSSGVGFGFEANKYSIAVVGADLDKTASSPDRQTAIVLDMRYKGIKVPGGSVELQANIYSQNNAKVETSNDDAAENGIGLGVTYNINKWYGLKDGWSKAAIAYGTGIGAPAKGLNFGSWVGGANENSSSILATTYGMVNLSPKLQMGTEVSIHIGENLYGQDSLTRAGVSVSPSYKVSKNLRLTADASIGMQTLDNPSAWGRSEDTEIRTALTLAPVFTLNNDFYGRPQIKPFVTFGNTSDDAVVLYDGKQNAAVVGVVGEVWF